MHGLSVRWLNLARLRRWFGRVGAERVARSVFQSYRPDLVLVFCRDLYLPLLKEFREAGATTALWLEEPIGRISQTHLEYLAHADLVFMTNPAHFSFLQEHGVGHTSFILDGVSLTHHHPWRETWWPKGDESRFKRDLVFIGGPGNSGQRVEFLVELSKRFDVHIYGNGWDKWVNHEPSLQVHGPVRPRAYRRICATSKIVLGINQINRDPLYFSNRAFLTLACRGFHLTHYVPGLERVFGNWQHLVWFDDFDGCVKRIEHFLERPKERDRIALAGHELVRDNHLFVHRMSEVLRALREGDLIHGPSPHLVRLPAPSVSQDAHWLAPGFVSSSSHDATG